MKSVQAQGACPRCSLRSKCPPPDLADQVVAEAVVGLLLLQGEAGALVNAAGAAEHAVGPQPHVLVASAAGELQAFIDQPRAQALAAQQAVRPASSAAEFQRDLSQVIQQLAHEEMVLIETMTGMDLLEKLRAGQNGQPVAFTADQARQAGAFVEDALDDQAASDGMAEMRQDQDPQGVVS